MNPRVVVISGPSGAGKSTIIKKAREAVPHLALSVSHTTREPREGELEGRDYHFVSRDAFESAIAEGGFLEWAEVYGNYYGTSRVHVQAILAAGNHALLDVDTQGAMNIKTVCSGVAFVFVQPPSLNQLEVRLRKRGSETDASLFKRLSQAEHEISFAGEYDRVIINEDADQAAVELVQFLLEEELNPAPFQVAATAATGPETPLGDDAFLAHLRGSLRERIRQNFTIQVRESVREELQQLINNRLDVVLERELDRVLQEVMPSPSGAKG